MSISDVTRHYDELLAEHYTWMFGVSFDDKVAEQRALLEALNVKGGGVAYDLGCGPGFQSIALADSGFARVIAVDASSALLAELDAHKGDRPIETVKADIRFPLAEGADTIVCMGDTLTHLPDPGAVARVCANALKALNPGGRLVLTFRDLSREPTERFFLVHGDRDKVMTCVLDYEPTTVVVTDLIHTRAGDTWTLRKSSYRKVRLAPDTIAENLTRIGFTIERNAPCGRLHAIVARA